MVPYNDNEHGARLLVDTICGKFKHSNQTDAVFTCLCSSYGILSLFGMFIYFLVV